MSQYKTRVFQDWASQRGAAAAGPSRQGEPNDRLVTLVYELLDAHDDTARLAADLAVSGEWAVHLRYLRDLQRIGREELARAARPRGSS